VVIITTGKVHDVNILDQLLIEVGAIYIMDRGYPLHLHIGAHDLQTTPDPIVQMPFV
jgi:hypothetical protein